MIVVVDSVRECTFAFAVAEQKIPSFVVRLITTVTLIINANDSRGNGVVLRGGI